MEPAIKRHRSASAEDNAAISTPAWEGVAAESMFQLFRELKQQMQVPQPCCATLCAAGTNCQSFDEEQKRFLKRVQGNCAGFDPAVDASALKIWHDRVKWIDVSGLNFARPSVPKRFLHGPHKGELVSELKKQLRTGKVQSKDIIPLVVMKWDQRYWVICGNRRLKAMKDYAPSMLPIKVRCIVHEPCAESASVVAMFLRMWDSTRNSELPDLEPAADTAVSPSRDQLSYSEPATGQLSDLGHSEGDYSSLDSVQQIKRMKVAKLSLEDNDLGRLDCTPEGKELYLRYRLEQLGEYGRELLEFEVRPDGLLRYASDSCLRKVRKQCYISQIMLAELERIVADSCILDPNVEAWPPAAATDRQELEIMQGSFRFVCSTRRVETPHDASGFEGMLAYFYLIADLEAFVFSVVRLHFGRDIVAQ